MGCISQFTKRKARDHDDALHTDSQPIYLLIRGRDVRPTPHSFKEEKKQQDTDLQADFLAMLLQTRGQQQWGEGGTFKSPPSLHAEKAFTLSVHIPNGGNSTPRSSDMSYLATHHRFRLDQEALV